MAPKAKSSERDVSKILDVLYFRAVLRKEPEHSLPPAADSFVTPVGAALKFRAAGREDHVRIKEL